MEIINITNINSRSILYDSSKLTCIVGFLFHVVRKISVYLVDENLMDKLYPPNKRIVIDKEKLKEDIKEYEGSEEQEELLKEIFEKQKVKSLIKKLKIWQLLLQLEFIYIQTRIMLFLMKYQSKQRYKAKVSSYIYVL